jgi:hypothetical protein
MTRNRLKSVLLPSVFAFFGIAIAQTASVPEGREIQLAGVVREIHGFGPPGYGEDKKSDSRITYLALELRTPITTPCTPERPEWKSIDCASAKRLRIFFPESPNRPELQQQTRMGKNHEMLVTGILHRADTVAEITPIYIDVTRSNLQGNETASGPSSTFRAYYRQTGINPKIG